MSEPPSPPSVWPFGRRRRYPVADRPPGPPAGVDALLRWKMNRWFDCLDADADGRLAFHDYELAALRAARAFGHRPGSREQRRLHSCFRKLWRRHERGAGPETGAPLGREMFVAHLAHAVTERRRGLVSAVNGLCCALVDVADEDGDNQVCEREYRVLLSAAFRLASERDLRSAYRTLDRDASGMLEHNEIHEAFVEFFTSTDPSAQGNWLLGAPPPRRPR
ncbi:EF-hand domain-containing protein [Streptomyces boncukensis]|uniref:EF-hand domain-containing protein n=1 Tax=Streptomyces boncukensis TaxID=2711219 RepID=A0A6G4X983_9ACTN|nr:hypothetical protein [Streptomyces boncukensis]NGO73221.1 hypothetical protein [Streptomyces boncukensis]